MQERTLIAMSGGVDSSVAAWLMRQDGCDCVGGMIRMFEPDLLPGGSDGACSAPENIRDAQSVAQRLGMDFHVFDYSGEFRSKVLEPFVRCYECGGTPNPCVDCNRHLKFGYLLESEAQLHCNSIATGHYAKITRDLTTGRYLLWQAADKSKDQTYFLYTLTQEQLSRVRFPLGDLTKEQVRDIAEAQGLITARKRDSQDICFIPDGDYVAFMKRFTGKAYPEGDFLSLDGKVVGRHSGAVCYTLGQRKGLGLAMGAPVYVCSKDMANNTVTVGPNEALYRSTLRANDWNWFPFPALTEPIEVTAKARYRHTPQQATVYPEENGFARVEFHQPQRALTPGQAVVLYQGEQVIGGGTITDIL